MQVGDADVEALGVGVGAEPHEVVDELLAGDPEVVGMRSDARRRNDPPRELGIVVLDVGESHDGESGNAFAAETASAFSSLVGTLMDVSVTSNA